MNHISRSTVFYELHSSTMDPCTMAQDDRERALMTWSCSGCSSPLPGTQAVDITIQETQPDNTPLNAINGCGIGVAQKEFLYSLGNEANLREHLYIGRVFTEKGSLLEQWVTFHGKHRIQVRGSKQAAYRYCPECGRLIYFSLGKQYLYPAPPDGIKIFHRGLGGLVVSADLAEGIQLEKWRKLKCIKLPVLASPTDGLGELPLNKTPSGAKLTSL